MRREQINLRNYRLDVCDDSVAESPTCQLYPKLLKGRLSGFSAYFGLVSLNGRSTILLGMLLSKHSKLTWA